MTWRLVTIAIAVAFFISPALAQSANRELLVLDREWAKAAASDDLEAVFSFWADDAEIYAPGRPPAIGIEEIRAFVEARRALPGSSISWQPLVATISSSEDLGYTRGTYEMTLPGPDGTLANVQGNYVSIWRRNEANNWKCILEIHSPMPSAVPAERP